MYYASFLYVSYLAYMATVIDPTDEVVLRERERKRKNLLVQPHDYYCSQCDSHVSEKAKHCKACDRYPTHSSHHRCVHDFDHHCKWLNNCIGRKNY